MTRKSTKTVYLLWAILWILLFFAFYKINKTYFLNDLGADDISFSVEFKTSEDDVFQLFYRDSINKLNESLSEKVTVTASKEFQWISFKVPDSLELMQLRFDFGNSYAESPVAIKQFKLERNNKFKIIQRDSLLSYFNINRFVTIAPDGSFNREVVENRSDPFFISNDLRHVVEELKRPTDTTLLNLILSLTLSLSMSTGLYWTVGRKRTGLIRHQFFVISFLGLITLPFLDNVFSWDLTQIEEKRELASRPILKSENIEDFPEAFENYFNDHFGFRNKMISYGGIIKAKVFKSSPREEKVMVGKSGMLFYWEEPSRHSFYNDNPFHDDSLGKFGEMLKNLSNLMDSTNLKLYISIYPDKHSVYNENIPSRFKKKPIETLDRETQLKSFLEQEKIEFISQKNHILNYKSKTDFPLYLYLDSHWNSLGAFSAYQNLIQKISSDINEIPAPLHLEDFKLIHNKKYKSGDLLDIMGVDNTYSFFNDHKIFLVPKKDNDFKISTNTKGARIIENPKSNNDKTLLVFGDSFTFELLKFLPYHFKETIFVRGIRINEELIELYHPDAVLYGIVERNLENF